MGDFESRYEHGPNVLSERKYQTGAGLYNLRSAAENMGALIEEQPVIPRSVEPEQPPITDPNPLTDPISLDSMQAANSETGHNVIEIRNRIAELYEAA
jgi:hypothetical protein